MNKLPDRTRAAILRCLSEGTSIRATARITDTSKTTVLKLLVEAGEFCSLYQDVVLRGLTPSRLEVDEIWSFVGSKQKNAKQEGHGDIWTFTALDLDSKLMVSWLVGDRSQANATILMNDIASRITDRIQLSTDGHTMYLAAARNAFRWDEIHYAQVVKSFGQDASRDEQRRYSPAKCTGVKKVQRIGRPNPDHISTSMVDRTNLTLRITTRRFTRLTNGYSKKAENHAHDVSLAFMSYNFCTPHGTLTKVARGIKTTPAMTAGVTDRVWTMGDVVSQMDPDRALFRQASANAQARSTWIVYTPIDRTQVASRPPQPTAP